MEMLEPKVINITESGSRNILRWAIKNNASLKDNLALNSIINDELVYLVTISGINFYQLFRLTQFYRDKLKIITVDRAMIPTANALKAYFGESANEVEQYLEMFTGLATQMIADRDIINEGTAQLFIPMICTTHTIQIPVSYIDIVDCLSADKITTIFNDQYPSTLEDILPSIKVLILSIIVKLSRNIIYNNSYEQLITLTKYSALKSYQDRLYKVGLVGFAKFNPITRGEARCNIFQANPEEVKSILSLMAKLKNPLEVDVAIQLPIYYWQRLEAIYAEDDLKILYRSSVMNIIDNGMVFHDFNSIDSQSAQVSNYKVRITDAHVRSLKLVKQLLPVTTIDSSFVFSMLPPIYLSNAVLRFQVDDIDQLCNNIDVITSDMFEEVRRITRTLKLEISQ